MNKLILTNRRPSCCHSSCFRRGMRLRLWKVVNSYVHVLSPTSATSTTCGTSCWLGLLCCVQVDGTNYAGQWSRKLPCIRPSSMQDFEECSRCSQLIAVSFVWTSLCPVPVFPPLVGTAHAAVTDDSPALLKKLSPKQTCRCTRSTPDQVRCRVNRPMCEDLSSRRNPKMSGKCGCMVCSPYLEGRV